MVEINYIQGKTKEEAFANAGFTTKIKCLDRVYKKGEYANPEAFMDEADVRLTPENGNVGYITIKPAVSNSRIRPWKLEQAEKQVGTRKIRKGYQFIDAETGNLLGTLSSKENPITGDVEIPTKAQAIQFAKDLMFDPSTMTTKFAGTIVSKIVYECDNDVAFKLNYEPSKDTQCGEYAIFTKA